MSVNVPIFTSPNYWGKKTPTNTAESDVKQIPKAGHLPTPD
jgi:hypothetical protein